MESDVCLYDVYSSGKGQNFLPQEVSVAGLHIYLPLFYYFVPFRSQMMMTTMMMIQILISTRTIKMMMTTTMRFKCRPRIPEQDKQGRMFSMIVTMISDMTFKTYEQIIKNMKETDIALNKNWGWGFNDFFSCFSTCTDPESFFRGGPTFFF